MRPKLDFRLSGRQYSLAMAEPSEMDQKSHNCTFILKLHHRYLCSPAKEPFPRLGAIQVLHPGKEKLSTAGSCVCALCSSLPHSQCKDWDTQSFTLQGCRTKACICYLLEAPLIIRKSVLFYYEKGFKKVLFPRCDNFWVPGI